MPLNVSRKSIIITNNKGRRGNAKNKSVNRINGPSNRLKNPDTTPTNVPKTTDKAIAVTPTNNETLPPARRFEKVSLPNWSVPMG